MRKAESKPKLWICLFDVHSPEFDRPTLRVILEFLKANPADGLLLGGDSLDFPQLSHHNKDKHILKPKGSLKRDLDGFNKHVLTPLENALPAHAKKVWIDGNHCRFLQDFIDESPELDGMLSHVNYLRLKERGWEHIKLGGVKRLGKLSVIHGETISGGSNAARKAVEVYGSNVLLGHFHSPQSMSKTSPAVKRHKFMGHVSPIVGAVAPRWMKGRSNSWINGFTIVLLRSNGQFNLYPVIVTEGKFSFGTETYGGGR